MHLQLLYDQEKREMIVSCLEGFGWSLSPEHVDRIVAAKQSENPLFLKALLAELRVCKDRDTLGVRIDHYLGAETIDGLYERILERYEQDYQRERDACQLVREAMSVIWASRRGISEAELLALLGSENGPLPRVLWSPLCLAAEELLVSKSGLLNFSNDYFRQAVEKRYCHSKDTQQVVHLWLADYFEWSADYSEKKPLNERQVDELPWQLRQGEDWARLKNCITDAGMFSKLRTDEKQYELMEYWRAIGNRFDLVQEYLRMINDNKNVPPVEMGHLLNAVAIFFYLNARYVEAEPLSLQAVKLYESVFGEEHQQVANILHGLAMLYIAQARYIDAEPLLLRVLKIYEKVYLGIDHKDVAAMLNVLAVLYLTQRRYQEAEPLFLRALQIYEKVFPDKDHKDAAAALNGLAGLYYNQSRYVEAEPLLLRALKAFENSLGIEHPDVASVLFNLAGLCRAQTRYLEAEPYCLRALAIREKGLPEDHPCIIESRFQWAQLLQDKSEHQESVVLYRQVIASCEKKIAGSVKPNLSLLWLMASAHNNIAFHIDVPAKNWKEAEAHYRKSIALFEWLENSLEVADVKLNLQILFHLSGKEADADKSRKLTTILDTAKDKRAEKGHKLLQELLSAKTGQ